MEITETSVVEPEHVAAVSVGADAVLLDVVVPEALAALVDRLVGRTLLRPLVDYVRTSRGEQQPVFVGYGRLTPSGNVEPLSDGALTPPS